MTNGLRVGFEQGVDAMAPRGKVIVCGSGVAVGLGLEEADLHEEDRVLVIQFATEDELTDAIKAGRCEFTLSRIANG